MGRALEHDRFPVRPRRVRGVDPLLELGDVEPAVRRVLAESRHDLLPVGVGGPKVRVALDRRAARHVSSGQCRRLLVHRRLA